MNLNYKSVILGAVCIGLLATNALTLTNDDFRQKAQVLAVALFGSTAESKELRALRSENEQLRAANLRLTDSDVKLRFSLAALVTATNLLVLKTTALAAEHTRLATVSRAQKETATAIRQKVLLRIGPAAARTVSSLPGKAIPALGTSVLLVTTVMDLRDLCETLKDMDSLGLAFGEDAADESKVCGTKVPAMEVIKAKASEYRRRVAERWHKHSGSSEK